MSTRNRVHLICKPTWKESLTSMMRCSGHTVLPRQQNQRGMEGTPGTSHKALYPSDSTPSLAAVSHHVSHDTFCSSKCVQTEEQQVEQVANLQAEVRDLQSDKRLLEQQLQAWRLSVQSEQSILEKGCCGVEGNVEVLRRETGWLEGLVTQALNKAAEKHIEEEERQEDDEDENEEEIIQDSHCEEEAEDEAPGHEEARSQEVDLLPTNAEEQEEKKEKEEEEQEEEQTEQEGVGVSVEEQLQQMTVQLRMEMEVEMGDRWSCSAECRMGAELVEAAGRIGASIHHLVGTVKITTSD